MLRHSALCDHVLFQAIRHREIQYGGNLQLKIYGTLHCSSGKRMHRKNRVFFATEQEAIANGFRPCGHCMKAAYQAWKAAQLPQ